jgi:hypothetical protein
MKMDRSPMRKRVRKRKILNALSVRLSDQRLATALPWLSRPKGKELSALPEKEITKVDV